MKHCRRCGLEWPLQKLHRVITPQNTEGLLVCRDDRFCYPGIKKDERKKLAIFLTMGKRTYFPNV